MSRSNGIYFSSRSGGNCWSRERGYHTPDPLPPHIMRILTDASPRKRQAASVDAAMDAEYGLKINPSK